MYSDTSTLRTCVLLPLYHHIDKLVDIKGNKTQVRKVDVSEYISWKDNLLLLHQRPVGDVLKKLERYYGCKIRYDAEITTLSLSGKLDLQTDITNVMDNYVFHYHCIIQ